MKFADFKKENEMTAKEYYIVDTTGKKFKIIRKYADYEAYANDLTPTKEGKSESFWLSLILFNLGRFDRKNLFEFIPDLKLSDIHKLLEGE